MTLFIQFCTKNHRLFIASKKLFILNPHIKFSSASTSTSRATRRYSTGIGGTQSLKIITRLSKSRHLRGRQFSSKPKVAVNEQTNTIEHLSPGLDPENGTIKRSINLKFPRSVIQQSIPQTSTPEISESGNTSNGKESPPATDNTEISDREKTLKNLRQPFVFIRDLSVAVDLKDTYENCKNVSLQIPNQERLIEITFDYQDGVLDNYSPSKAYGSVTERLWRETALDLRKLPQYYMKLSKARLTGLVVITSMAGYAVAPDPFLIQTFIMCTVGTALTSSSANAINQFLEIPYDSQMNRTKNRVLVRGHLSPLHAASFAAVSGSLGVAILYFGVNPLTALLGAFNLGLYTMVYTPMKRYSIANTWVGSLVGAIPPMMGWTACTGMLEPGAWLLGAIMYAWQFPHFNSLSWNLRPDYSRGGYRMASVVRPQLCKVVALRHSAGLIFLCAAAPLADLTSWYFVVDSLPLNLYMTYLAWNFYRKGDSNSSRQLFRFTLAYIPAVMLLMFIAKKGKRDDLLQTWMAELKEGKDKLGGSVT